MKKLRNKIDQLKTAFICALIRSIINDAKERAEKNKIEIHFYHYDKKT